MIKNPISTFSIKGIETIGLTATYSLGAGSNSKQLIVSDAPAGGCVVSGTSTPNGGGVKLFNIGTTINNLTENSYYDGNIYKDYSLTNNIILKPNSQYLLKIMVGTANPLDVYLDYNNDGDFLDDSELIYTSGSTTTTYTEQNFTTMESPPVYNQLLRLRVIARDLNTLATPCPTFTDGQAEDYGVLFEQSGALPVNLISFEASKNNESIELLWKTANEKDFNYSELQRSSDGKEFVGLAVVKGSKSEFYGYRDVAPIDGKNYYRLKMVDKDGSSKLSRIIAIAFEIGQKYLLVQSPTSNKSFVVFTNVSEPKMQLFSISGSAVPMTIVNLGNNKHLVKVVNVTSGLYILKMENDGKTFTQKVIVP